MYFLDFQQKALKTHNEDKKAPAALLGAFLSFLYFFPIFHKKIKKKVQIGRKKAPAAFLGAFCLAFYIFSEFSTKNIKTTMRIKKAPAALLSAFLKFL